MVDDLEHIKRLPPEERIAALRTWREEREKELKNELNEASKLITESEGELERDRLVERIDIPDALTIDISDLFKGEPATVKEKTEREEFLKYQVGQAYDAVKEAAYTSLTNAAISDLEKIEDHLDKFQGLHLSKEVSTLLDATKSVIYNIKKYSGAP
ncbi:MAG: hypothetical protein ABIH34_01485 [Nanoarchaeota archaeon]